MADGLCVWVDIDNPPQVQYLLPLGAAFEAAGARLVVTARDYGITYELLRGRGVDFHPVGASFGKARRRKALGVLGRARSLMPILRREGPPDVSVSASRSAAVAARMLGIPSFIVNDYEFVHNRLYRYTRSFILHPGVIDERAYVERGVPPERLVAFSGIKEDLSFAGLSLETVRPHDLGVDERLVRVLFRPPAEESHYYRSRSRDLALAVLRGLAAREDAVVILSPRYPWQSSYLDGLPWANEPVVLSGGVPFLSLLRAVDVIVSAGGTMAREAAYLGIPAYSTFAGEAGAVDRHLAAVGRLRLITSEAEAGELELRKSAPAAQLGSNPDLGAEIVARVLDVVRS